MIFFKKKKDNGDWGKYYYRIVDSNGLFIWYRVYRLAIFELFWNELGYWCFEVCISLNRSAKSQKEKFFYTQISKRGLWVQVWLDIKNNWGSWLFLR